jgi:hypothetical protein
MTKFDHFAKDKKFHKTISPLVNFIDENYPTLPYVCSDAWGFEVRPQENTVFHDHSINMVRSHIFEFV